MVYPGFMKNKTNECHNKCYTGCHGDDISDQEGGHFYMYPETRVKTPAKISPLKGPKFSFSTSEIFNKNLKIGHFYPGLPYLL